MGQLSISEMKLLEFYSKEVCNAKRIEEVLLLKEMIGNGKVAINDFIRYIDAQYDCIPTNKTISSVVKCLNAEFFKEQDQIKYGVKDSVNLKEEVLEISPHLLSVLRNEHFKNYLSGLT